MLHFKCWPNTFADTDLFAATEEDMDSQGIKGC